MKEKTQPITAIRVKEILRIKGWTQSELANYAGVTQQTVQQWASGKTTPTGERLRRLAQATGKPEWWFFSGREEDNSAGPSSTEQSDMPESEARLLELFRQLPEVQKEQVIHHVENVVEEMKTLFEELLAIHNKTSR